MASEYEIERRLAALETRSRTAIDGSYIARYILPPVALIALIAVYALYVAFQVPEMTRGEAARTVPGAVGQAVQARVPEVVRAAVPPAVAQQVDRAVPEVVGRELPGLVDHAVQEAVARAVPEAVARAVPEAVAQQVASAVPEAAQRTLPGLVERAVPEAVSRAVPPAANDAVGRQVPDAVRTALAQALPPAVEQAVAASLSPQARDTLDRMRLVQMGSHQCPQVRRRAAESWTVIYRATVTFSREFREPPAVFLSVGQMEAYFAQPALTYSVLAENVTRQGFDLVVRGAFLESLTACQVQWIALDRGFQVGDPAAVPAPLRPPSATGG
jgi:hypothetical protein